VLPVLRIVQGVGPLAGREALDDAATRNAAARLSGAGFLWRSRLCRRAAGTGALLLRLRFGR
jgi:hypothetical protein